MTSQISDGIVLAVNSASLGDELTVNAAVGALSLTVDDAADFAEQGGTLRLGNAELYEVIAYTACNDTTGVITLTIPTVNAWPVASRVELYDTTAGAPFTEYVAQVRLHGDEDNDDALLAVVEHALVPLLPEGIRNPGEGESVMVELTGTQWIVTNVVGKQAAIRGDLIVPASIPKTALSFTVGSTTATVGTAPLAPAVGDLWFDSANGYVMKAWDGAAWQPYTYGAGAIANGAISAAKVSFTAHDIGGLAVTIAAVAPATPATGDLWYDSANGYRPNRWSGTAWVAVQFGTAAITAGSITAALIAADTITAAQIAAGAITASELAVGAVTATAILAGTITGDRIASGAITSDLIAAGAIVAGKIAVGALDALTINAGALTAGVLSSGAIGSSSILDSFISTTRFTVDANGGQVLVYSTGAPVVSTVTVAGAGSYTVPAGVTSIKVEAWGAGQGGDGGFVVSPTSGPTPVGGSGGGAGEYACEPALTVVPGSVHPYVVGAGGAGGAGAPSPAPSNPGVDGGATTFDSTAVVAHGGTQNFGGSGSTNSLHFNGGSGGHVGYPGTAGGGGGSSAGPSSIGNTGTASGGSTGGSGGRAVAGGGAGGAGGASTANGVAATAPGGAGGGGGGTVPAHAGGAGAAGQLRITYVPSRVLVASIAGVASTDAYGLAYPAGLKLQRPDLVGVIGGYYRSASFVQTIAGSTSANLTALTTIKEFSDYGVSPWSGATFTAPADGIYTFYIYSRHVIAAVGPDVGIAVNAQGKARGNQNPNGTGGTSQASTALSNYWLAAGDVVTFNVINNSTTSTAFQGNVTAKREA